MSLPELWWALDVARLQEELKWRQTREIVAMVYNTNAKRSKKSTELMPLSIDKPIIFKKLTVMTATEFKKFMESKGKKVYSGEKLF